VHSVGESVLPVKSWSENSVAVGASAFPVVAAKVRQGNKVSALSLSKPAAFLRDPLSSRVRSTRTDGQGLVESKRNGIDRASQAIGVPYP